MSQTRVTKHYSVRKRNIHNVEGIKELDNIVSKEKEVKNVLEKLKTTDKPKVKTNPEKLQKKAISTFIEKKGKSKQSTLKTFFTSELDKPKNDKVTNESDKNSTSIPAVSLKAVAECEISLTCSPKQNLPVSSISVKDVAETDITLTCSPKRNLPSSVRVEAESEICSLTRSPKRNLPSPTDDGTPSKRKHLEVSLTSEIETVTTLKPKEKESARRKLKLESDESRTIVSSPCEKLASVNSQKSTDLDIISNPKEASAVETNIHRKLRLDSPSNKTRINVQLSDAKIRSNSRKDFLDIVDSPKREQSICKLKVNSPRKLMLDSLSGKSRADIHLASPKKNLLRTPDKLDALIDSSRSTMVLSPKLDELKKARRLFSEKTGTLKECRSGAPKSTILSSPKSPEKKLPSRPLFASEHLNHWTQTESLVVPLKYKMLAEMFRYMDFLIVAILNNRKETITFEKVKESLQRIMKKNFSEKHLGQIVTVFPTAYSLSREKARCISKKNNADYPLVIVPNVAAEKGNNQKISTFQLTTSTCLAHRINEFNNNLLDIVKGHHQDFLRKINFATISNDDIKKWHPKFLVDTVPDVPAAQLPESPEMRVYTAKDVLNKIKGSIQAKVDKALQSEADKTEYSGGTLELEEIKNSKPEASKKAVKGISFDLLEKIRAKESAKLLNTMTQNPEEKKKLAMIERVPKIAKIVMHYFISECKTALPVDSVVEKIIYSFNSLSTPDFFKEHLELIAKQFPHWLKFIKLRKGLYLTINKKTNINEMLDKAGMHYKTYELETVF